jgi:hypothetical protein
VRRWDTHPVSIAILPCFQQHAPKPHRHWRFLRSRLFQLFQSFRLSSANFGPKQTPKTPNKTPGARSAADNSTHAAAGLECFLGACFFPDKILPASSVLRELMQNRQAGDYPLRRLSRLAASFLNNVVRLGSMTKFWCKHSVAGILLAGTGTLVFVGALFSTWNALGGCLKATVQ